jgi:transposase
MLTRRVTFRLYPSEAQTAKLFEARRLHAYLYNACVEHRKTSYQKLGKSISYFDQQAALVPSKADWQEYRSLNHGSLQAKVKRVDFAFQRFFKGLGSYPKFKTIRHYSGWTYPDARQGFKVHSDGRNGYLELRDLGLRIKMRGQARSWGTPTTCTIVHRNGLWYVSITVNCQVVRKTGSGAVGIDFGVLTAAALSDGTRIENPRFIAAMQAKIRKASKAKRRKRSPNFKQKVKASKRWRKASKRVAKLQRKVANQRQNWVHQVAAQIVSRNSLVATEKLTLQGMTRKARKGKRKAQKSALNRSILDVGMGMLRAAIAYKLAAAQVMLNWARGKELASLNVDGSSSTDCGSMKQLAQTKRQKLLVQRSG